MKAPRRKHSASVLVIVMITLIFATVALVVFMDKASNDLLVEQRDAEGRRLRREAYSALEVTLAVLEDFRGALNGLRSPAEGWGDPLTWAGYVPTEERTVEIAFEDESGKISLPRANAQVLTLLFKNWQIQDRDAETLADAMLGWMRNNHIYSTGMTPTYEQAELPFLPPGRSLRSLSELAAIDKVRETFFTDGVPNELWARFAAAVSLLDFQRPNINGARPDTLAAVAQFDLSQQQTVSDYLNGTGMYATQGPNFFQAPADAMRISAGGGGDLSGFAPTISALRITVTVHDGRSVFRLAAVIAPQGGATTIQTNATSQRAQTSANTGRTANQQAQTQRTAQGANANNPNNPAAARGGANPAATNLRYPFTLLEIRENDEIPPAPPPPPTDQPR